MPDAASACATSSGSADDAAETVRIAGSTMATATIATDAIAAAKKSPTIATDAADATDAEAAGRDNQPNGGRGADDGDRELGRGIHGRRESATRKASA